MLAPDRTETLAELSDIATRWAALFAFSHALQAATIGDLTHEPAWLKTAKDALAKNRADVEQFFLAEPNITVPLVHPFQETPPVSRPLQTSTRARAQRC